MTNKSEKKHDNTEQKKAAYALNMCAVSVSQIIDYHDAYILEQEYNAILNNLNLKQMPKDEAFLNIISELLNTITFFRIQEIKKEQIEKKYKQRMTNAIWSAVPSLSVVVSNNPVAIALSLATQIGSGYMNYRREKVNAGMDKEDAEIELEITAIEQLHALRRELFTTAWRIADEYDFADEWRLTEKQIKQYNEILRDQDEYRKYARLESIADKFEAYPPFWYFYGHTANYIAEMAKERLADNHQETDRKREGYYKDLAVIKEYTDKAKGHYEHYYSMCGYNILREDQFTSQFALEYIDILWDDEKNRDINKINELIKLAESMAANSFDILQLCAVSYLKTGQTGEAARVLKILVNEEYNTSANAKLLSRIYVSQFLFGNKRESEKAMAEYQILSASTNSVYLFPMPIVKPEDAKLEDSELQKKYIEEQKILLQKDYRLVINEFIKSCIVKYNKLWPVPNVNHKITEKYFDYSVESRKKRYEDVEKVLDGEYKTEYIVALRDSSFRIKYLDLLNWVIRSLDELIVFRNYENKDDLVLGMRKNIIHTRDKLKSFQSKLEKGDFAFEDYLMMQEAVSFQRFTEPFFNELKSALMDQLDNIEEVCAVMGETPMKYLETAEIDLIEFCRNHSITDPEETRKNRRGEIGIPNCNYYFDYSIFGDSVEDEIERKAMRDKMHKVVKKAAGSLIIGDKKDIEILLPESDGFNIYFQNVKLGGADFKSIILAVIDDKTRKDKDFLLAYDGFIIVEKNQIQPIRDYNRIHFAKLGSGDELEIGWPDKYSNKNVDMSGLYNLIQKLADISALS